MVYTKDELKNLIKKGYLNLDNKNLTESDVFDIFKTLATNDLLKNVSYISLLNNNITKFNLDTLYIIGRDMIVDLSKNPLNMRNIYISWLKTYNFDNIFPDFIIISEYKDEIYKLNSRIEYDIAKNNINEITITPLTLAIAINESKNKINDKFPTDYLLFGYDIFAVLDWLVKIDDKILKNPDNWWQLYLFLVYLYMSPLNIPLSKETYTEDKIPEQYRKLQLYKKLYVFFTSLPMINITNNIDFIKLYNKRTIYYLSEMYNKDYINRLESVFKYRSLPYFNIISPFIVNLTKMTPDEIIASNNNFMIFPSNIITEEQKLNYYLNNINNYINYFKRTTKEITTIFSDKSDNELNLLYPFKGLLWVDRSDLIRKIKLLIKREHPFWMMINVEEKCVNPVENDILGDVRISDDVDNPIITYGLFNKYRCYNLNTLYETWNPLELTFKDDTPIVNITNININNPLYTGPTKTGYEDTMDVFPIEDIEYLNELLKLYHNPKFDNMISLTSWYLKTTTYQYNQYNVQANAIYRDIKLDMENFILSVFLMSMYARFWTGFYKVTDWPYELDEYANNDMKANRDKNVGESYYIIESMLNKNNKLKNYVENMDIVKISWNNIKNHINTADKWYLIYKDSIKGNMCLADLSDRFSRHAYYFVINIFKWTNDDFNIRLKKYMTELAISNNLNTENINKLPDFIPENMILTTHIDPGHRPTQVNITKKRIVL
jgi:hypothetical protein